MVKTVLYVHVNALWGGGASILRGDLTEDLLRYEFGGGLIHGGACFRKLTVVL